MKSITIEIDGAEQTFDLDEALAIREPESERMLVAVELAYWGGIWAAKIEAEEMADAHYHAWRGETICDLLKGEEKAAEWKVKEFVLSQPAYLEKRKEWAKAKRDVQAAKSMFEAYNRKADILARLINREDTERVRSGEIGRAPEPKVDPKRTESVAAAIAATRAKRSTTT